MEHNYKLLDSDNGVASCSMAEIPEKYKKDIVEQGGDLAKLTFYFDREHDLIVLNEDNREFKGYLELILDMMRVTDEVLLKMSEMLPEEVATAFENLFSLLITVKRYRVLKEGSRGKDV